MVGIIKLFKNITSMMNVQEFRQRFISTTILSYTYETAFIENNSIIILSLICLILDGFDGYFARLLRSSSSFGELFDQEVDNFMMLTLATSLYLNINI